MKRIAVGAACALAIGGGAVGAALATADGDSNTQGANVTGVYNITVQNLSAGQPLSPPLIVKHDRRARVWQNGTAASHVVANIAEDANNAPAIQLLNRVRGVQGASTGVDQGATAPAPIPPGAGQTYRVRVNNPTDRVSLISMLVNTNDGFTGLDSYRLRNGTRVLVRRAYDGGSETNNQLARSIPGPCCNNPMVRDPEGRTIRPHPGLRNGVGQLTRAQHGFNRRAVARITVEKVS